jgi:hypothetical protein
MVMALTTFFAIVSDLEAHAVGVLEKRSGLVGSVLWIQFRFCGADPEVAQLLFNGPDIGG